MDVLVATSTTIISIVPVIAGIAVTVLAAFIVTSGKTTARAVSCPLFLAVFIKRARCAAARAVVIPGAGIIPVISRAIIAVFVAVCRLAGRGDLFRARFGGTVAVTFRVGLAAIAVKKAGQLFFHDLAGDFVNFARGHLAQMERPIGQAHQARYRPAQMFHHPADFAVLAFAQCDGHPGIGAFLNINFRLDRPVIDTVNRNAVF